MLLEVVLPTLIRNREKLHVQQIHDYVRNRIWRAHRTAQPADAETGWWRQQTSGAGMGEQWAAYLHIETTREGWHDATLVDDRPD